MNNAGERIALVDAAAAPILDFEYDGSWYSNAQNEGFSLVIRDPLADAATWGQKSSWRPSQFTNGNPGAADNGLDLNSIVVNEILIHTDQAAGDWIELKNLTNNPINIGGWYLSDRPEELKRYRIAPGTTIPNGGLLTLTQTANFGNGGDPGTIVPFQFSELGDETAILSQADANGDLMGFRESQSHGASDREVTFGRYVKSTGSVDFVTLATPTFGQENSLPKVGPIVINELMYQPAAGGDEFIELHNITAQSVPLYLIDFEPRPPSRRHLEVH